MKPITSTLLKMALKVMLVFCFALTTQHAKSQCTIKIVSSDSGLVCGESARLSINSDWQIVNTIPLNKIRSLSFPQKLTGYDAGDSGSVYKTTNGGSSFTQRNSPKLNTTIRALWFFNGDTGLTFTSEAEIFKTSNGGVSWTSINYSYVVPDSAYTWTSKTFSSAFFTSNNVGYVGGSAYSPSGISRAILHKTTDGGNTWTQLFIPNNKPIEKIYFIDSLTGFLCTNGNLLKTTNGGASWTSSYYYPNLYFSDITFINKDTGFVASNGLLKTIDGGTTWFAITTPFSFPSGIGSDQYGFLYVTLGSEIYKSIDYGNTWLKLSVNGTLTPMYSFITGISFAQKNAGIAVGINTQNELGFILKLDEIDSVKWNPENGLTDSLNKSPIVYPNASTTYFVTAWLGNCTAMSDITILVEPVEVSLKKSQIIACGDSLQLSLTSNFTPSSEFSYQWFPSNFLSDPSARNPIAKVKTSTRYTVLATNGKGCFDTATTTIALNFGVNAPENKYLKCGTSVPIKIIEGGWSKQVLDINPIYNNALTDVDFPHPDTAFITNGTNIWRSLDKGKTWAVVYSKASPTGLRPNKTFFRNPRLGFATAFNDGPMTGAILKTTDGVNWQAVTLPGNYTIPAIFFPSDQTGFAIGHPGKILKSTNSGNNWVAINTGVSNFLNDIYFTSISTGYVCGESGTILKTTDGGANWTKLNTGIIAQLQTIHFTSQDTGFVAGTSDTVWRTVNGGSTWIPFRYNYNFQTSYVFKDIHFINNQTGYMIAQYSIVIPMFNGAAIFETKNGGLTWERNTNADSSVTMNAIFADASGFGMAVGENNTALFKNSGPNSYEWSPSAGLNQTTGTSVVANPTQTKTYTVTAFINDCFEKDSVTVQVLPFMNPAQRNVELVCGDSFSFTKPNVRIEIQASDQGLSSWEILNAQGVKIMQSKPDERVFGNYELPPGNYTFKCRPILLPPPLTIRIIPIVGDSISEFIGMTLDSVIVRTFTIVNTQNYNYQWWPNQSIITPSTLEKTYALNITSPIGCFGSDSIKIIPKPLRIKLDKSSYGFQHHNLTCGLGIQLDSIISNYTGPNKLKLSWSEPIAVRDTNSFYPYLHPNKSGVIYVRAYDTLGCLASDSVAFTIEPLFVRVIDTNVSCKTSFRPNIMTNYTGIQSLQAVWQPTTELDSANLLKPLFTPSANRDYLVYFSTFNGCLSQDSFQLRLAKGNAPSLCLVSVDEQNKNQIIWNKSQSLNTEKFFLYKETNITDEYSKIAELLVSADFIFTDSNSFPMVQSNKYKLERLDVCGLTSLWSEPHKTMHLTINKGIGTTWNLIWNKYEGFQVSTYNIYRGTTPFNLVPIGTSSGSNNSYSDLNAPTGDVYYQVEIISPFTCSPTKTYNTSRSNIISNKNLSNADQMPTLPITIYPNPTHDKLQISINSYAQENTISLLNLNGEVLIKKVSNEQLMEISLTEFPSGLYVVLINNNNGSIHRFVVKE